MVWLIKRYAKRKYFDIDENVIFITNIEFETE